MKHFQMQACSLPEMALDEHCIGAASGQPAACLSGRPRLSACCGAFGLQDPGFAPCPGPVGLRQLQYYREAPWPSLDPSATTVITIATSSRAGL